MALERQINNVLDFFYPKICIGCGKEKTFLCKDCFFKIQIFTNPVCPYCTKRSFEGLICKNHKTNLKGFVAVASYGNNFIRKIIDFYKYQFVKDLASSLSLLVFKFLKENPQVEFFKNPLDFILIPIPLHPRRLRWRGFNQAEEIANNLSKLIKIPVKSTLLVRHKNTKPQARLNKNEKKENIKDAFRLNKKSLKNLKNKKVILIDDVATTLSTIEEAAKLLKENEVKEVWGLTVAKG
jgi:ComF family protein